ncbi:MAG: hypothetical protein JXA43_01850 [Candidatus Diapherotrites archaeon]|nr:hypothetical protein [Candidatus Diapherotrites archaeon]
MKHCRRCGSPLGETPKGYKVGISCSVCENEVCKNCATSLNGKFICKKCKTVFETTAKSEQRIYIGVPRLALL